MPVTRNIMAQGQMSLPSASVRRILDQETFDNSRPFSEFEIDFTLRFHDLVCRLLDLDPHAPASLECSRDTLAKTLGMTFDQVSGFKLTPFILRWPRRKKVLVLFKARAVAHD